MLVEEQIDHSDSDFSDEDDDEEEAEVLEVARVSVPASSRKKAFEERLGNKSEDEDEGGDEEAEILAGSNTVTATAREQRESLDEPKAQYATLHPPSDHLAPPVSPTLSTYSGSDYSQNDSRPTSLEMSTPSAVELPAAQETRKSRPASIMVQQRASPSPFVEEPLHTPNAETKSQPPISPGSIRSSQIDTEEAEDTPQKVGDVVEQAVIPDAKRGSQHTLNFDLMQSPSPYDDASPWHSQQVPIPTVKTELAVGSENSTSTARSPQTPKMPISPLTPDSHMSISDMESVRLSDSSLDYDHLSSEQVNDALATPRAKGRGHLRKPSSLEILQNNWMPEREPLQRQSTFFDITKDDPLETPIDGDFDPQFGKANSSSSSMHSSAPSVTVVDTTSNRSSMATPTRR